MCFFLHRTSGLSVLAERTEGEFRNNKTKQKQEKQSKTKSFEWNWLYAQGGQHKCFEEERASHRTRNLGAQVKCQKFPGKRQHVLSFHDFKHVMLFVINM